MRQRVVTAALGVALVVSATLLGGVWLAILFAAIAAVSTLEIGAMMKVRVTSAENLIAVAFTVLMVIWGPFEQFWYVLFYALLITTILRREQFSFAGASMLFAAALYSSYAFRMMLDLRALNHGFGWVLLVFIAIWSTDTGAFFIGRAFGGRKLLPEVSPKKTVSGAFGGFLFATVMTPIAGGFLLGYDIHRMAMLGLLALLGAATSIAGQLGDLVESALKRHYAVKDSGWILPGHGGILDRFDSLLLAAPIAYHLIIWLFPHV
ncbi:hypothetical protein BM613_04590 [Sulfoacidibacillus thermotolerans]|uniref:Phosphatidate cytidylyltransferase n=1 Tax=Sulfoacidibacillus thermotolerans TaxID=1765684 RepID=A0A2U3DAJ0_SULT2|nr:hypothetical protein BM613_04590 [Sulfoacidibacillus thermotolerans]